MQHNLNFQFKAQDVQSQDNGNIKFKGIAYTGAVIQQWVDYEVKDCIIDLNTIALGGKVPILWGHSDYTVAIGWAELIKTENGIEANGYIIKNDNHDSVYHALIQGYDLFQMSIGGDVSQWLKNDGGETIINGTKVEDELIGIGAIIKEVSVVNFGADDKTSMKIAASKQLEQNKKVLDMELEQLKAELAQVKLQNDALLQENATLKASAAESNVRSKFAAANVQLDESEIKAFAAMNEDQLNITLKHLAKPAQESTKVEFSKLGKNVELHKQATNELSINASSNNQMSSIGTFA